MIFIYDIYDDYSYSTSKSQEHSLEVFMLNKSITHQQSSAKDSNRIFSVESKKISNDQVLIQSDPTSCPQNQKGNN